MGFSYYITPKPCNNSQCSFKCPIAANNGAYCVINGHTKYTLFFLSKICNIPDEINKKDIGTLLSMIQKRRKRLAIKVATITKMYDYVRKYEKELQRLANIFNYLLSLNWDGKIVLHY